MLEFGQGHGKLCFSKYVLAASVRGLSESDMVEFMPVCERTVHGVRRTMKNVTVNHFCNWKVVVLTS